MTNFKQSPVLFNEEQHTYTLGELSLSGITSIIHRYIFPDMYAAVSQAVLDKAAERGSRIHKNIELLQAGVIEPNDVEEIRPFVDATKDIHFVASEYLVSDNQSVASSIDLIGEDDNGIVLYDIKTTSVLNMEYLQWQLSIYAYLFEGQNEGLQVAALNAIHIRGNKCQIVPITRLPNEYVVALLDAYRNDADTFINPLHTIPDVFANLLQEYANVELALVEINATAKPLEERKKELQENIANALQSKGLQKLETDTAKITVGKDTERESFDLKAFRASDLFNAEQFGGFIKTTKVKGRVTITLK